MRYIIADADSKYWGHLFEEDGKTVERTCSFVFDNDELQLHSMRIQRDQDWGLPTRDDMADLEDSLLNANPWALDNPKSYGLRASDEIPDWASEYPSPQPGM